jgi:CRP-like cAMP-binding protein
MTTCPTCGIRFHPTPANPTYCAPACWQQVREERTAEAARAAAAKPAQTPTSKAKPKRRPRSERFAALNAFVDMGMAGLTGAETKVWLILFRDTKGAGTARTGQADLARRAGLSVRHAKRVLQRLQAKGMVSLVHRGRLNVGPSIYTVHPVGTP